MLETVHFFQLNISLFYFIFWYRIVKQRIFVPIGIIKKRFTKVYPKYFNGNLWLYHLFFLSILFLHGPFHEACFYEKLISELQASYTFKTTSILVRQVLSLKKNSVYHQQNFLFNLMVFSLHSFSPFISINGNGKFIDELAISTILRVDTPGKLLI